MQHRGEWHPGKQEPLIDRPTWNRVQKLLGGKVYRSHELVYASGLIRCGECGHFITGEQVRKKRKDGGENIHVYYRCSKYSRKGHKRTRVKEAKLDEQVLELLAKIRIDNDDLREWFAMVLRSQTRDAQEQSKERRDDLQRQLSTLMEQQDRLLNMRLLDELDADAFTRKRREMRDRESELKLRIEAADRSHHETADLAMKAFELSQSLTEKWLTADYAEKRTILEIVCLNLALVDGSLCYELRKPFDVLAEGLVSEESRDETCCTFVDEWICPVFVLVEFECGK